LNTDSVINYSKAHYLTDLPDNPQWVDGSGLSRRNLFTPRTIISLLCKIRGEVKDENFLHSLMPAGGVAGTIRTAYKTDNGQPFVWAKTGSLSNNYNQSGYLVTRKGRHLAFSFMNNNFTRPAREVRDEMVRIMTYIHENY
jgi:D-alanyl-D-alanine carboxypeptidase/D-alanyl-D-alanine-endopeptidase (penicillin-binding protein 4)